MAKSFRLPNLNPSPPDADQMERMRETLNHHLRRFESEGKGDAAVATLMSDALQRMNRGDGVDSCPSVMNQDHNDANSTFSDTFSESFLCSAEAAAVGDDAAPASDSPSQTFKTPQHRKHEAGKRKTGGLKWTPLHGIERKKAALPPFQNAERDCASRDGKQEEEVDEDEDLESTLCRQLDASIDLFE